MLSVWLVGPLDVVPMMVKVDGVNVPGVFGGLVFTLPRMEILFINKLYEYTIMSPPLSWWRWWWSVWSSADFTKAEFFVLQLRSQFSEPFPNK
jgi:hypothetical protein